MIKLTDITDEVDKVEINVADDDGAATTVVLTNGRGTITVTGKMEVVEHECVPLSTVDAGTKLGTNSDPIGPPAPVDDERKYPCDDCGRMRTKAEGGTVFTVCDACWDKHHGKPSAPVDPVEEPTLREVAEDCCRLALNAFGPPRVEEADWQKAIDAIEARLAHHTATSEPRKETP